MAYVVNIVPVSSSPLVSLTFLGAFWGPEMGWDRSGAGGLFSVSLFSELVSIMCMKMPSTFILVVVYSSCEDLNPYLYESPLSL